MPPKRRSATASNTSSSASTPVPLRSTRSSAKSTPATSVPTSSGEEPKKTQSAAGRKRNREEELDSDALDESDVAPEPATKPRGRKKRAMASKVTVKPSALQEKPAPKAKPAPKTTGSSRATRPSAKSTRGSGVSTLAKEEEVPTSDKGEVSDSEDDSSDSEEGSVSEFEGSDVPEGGAPGDSDIDIPLSSKIKSKPRGSRRRAKSLDSDALDDDSSGENASEDEALMLEAAIQASLAPKNRVDENGAGPSTSRAPATSARNKAAALRAAAAERRLGIKTSEPDDLDFEYDEESAESTDGSDEPLSKKQGKGEKKTGVMTFSQMRAERLANKAAEREEMAPLAAAIRKKKRELRRGLTPAERTAVALLVYHPELENVWGDLEKVVKPIKPEKAPQPAGLKVALLPFQQESLYWMRKQETGPWGGGMLADEMGMGKTIQTLALFVSDKRKPNLVVAPTVALMQWKNEIESHTENLKVYLFYGGSREKSTKELAKYDVVLTTYAVLEASFRKQISGFKRGGEIVKEKSPLHAVTWHRIVLDEAHNIKERSTNTAKGAFELKGEYRWCLSGTPLQNRVGELYSLVRFIGGDPFSYYFCKRCSCKSLHWRFSDKRGCDDCGHSPMNHTCFWNNEILTPIQKDGMNGPGAIAFKKLRILLDRMMLRRTKVERADDLGLPPRTVIVRRDYFSPEERELYTSLFKEAKREFSTYVDTGKVLNNYTNIFSLLTRMRQMACHPDLVLKSRQNVDLSGDITEAMPACPVCHIPISIDLDGLALEQDEEATARARQGILGRLDIDSWRSSTKIEALVEELDTLRRQDATIKSIVFSQFVNFLDLIAFRLQRAGFSICRLEGSMSPEARNNTIQHFMKNVGVTVFLVSLKAGGVALNLTEASRVYLMDSWWNPAVEFQAMDRIHRLGQRRPVQAIKLIVEDSIESRIVLLQEKKSAMVDATLSADDNAIGRLTPEDLSFLFRL